MEGLTLAALLKYGWSPFVAWYIYSNGRRKEADKELEDRLKTIEIEKNAFVTRDQMKEAIIEALEPYKEDQQEIKILLRGLNDQIFSLSKDMAVQNALRDNNDIKNKISGGG